MRSPTPVLLAAAALLALAPAAALAQREGAVRDTIRFGARPAAAGGDSIVMADRAEPAATEDTAVAPARRRTPDRWARPFEVEGSGRPAPLRREREVVWIHPDSIARPDSAEAVDDDGEAAEGDFGDEIALDTTTSARTDDAPPARRRTSASAGEETGSTAASRRRASTSTSDGEQETPSPTRRRTASSEEESSASSSRRRTASSEEEGTPPASNRRRAASSEEAESSTSSSNRRRAASADAEEEETPAASRRRASARDTASSERRSPSRTASRETRDAEDSDPPAERSERPASTSARGRAHTVAAGETFFGIARRYGVTTAQLRALNPSVDWEALEIGTVLRLPAAARERGQSATTRTAPSTSDGERRATTTPARTAAGRRTHTVERGETLFGIARRYGVTVAALRQANDLEEDQGIRAGQTLTIPAAPRSR